MATFIGTILDFSNSMRNCISDDESCERDVPWVRSVFTVIDDLVKHDVAQKNQVFTIGIGAKRFNSAFDILRTVKLSQKIETNDPGPASYPTINRVFQKLESNGARTIRKWAEESTVRNVVSECEAELLLQKLNSDQEFTNTFVNDFLPPSCRDWGGGYAGLVFEKMFLSAVTSFVQAKEEDIQHVVPDALSYLLAINGRSVIDVHEAADIIHGSVDEQSLTHERTKELHENVEPFIYGGTPLYSAIREALSLFSSKRELQKHHKLLFVLSDGEPTDSGNKRYLKSTLKDKKITVVGCFVSSFSGIQPRRLYTAADSTWHEGAKFLFDLSSYVPTEYVTRAIFIKRGWQIDTDNNETRLFIHVNHPENIKDAVELAQNAVCCQDTLSELLISVDLDIYIYQSKD